VGVVELHDALAPPGTVRLRPGVSVDQRHLVPATGQCDAEDEPGRPRTDHPDPHSSIVRRKWLCGEGDAAYGVRVELTSRSAIRGVAPHQVVEAVETYFDGSAPGRAQLVVAGERDGWTTLTWPAYFAPRDLTVCQRLSRELHTVVSAITTTDDEGWSHTLFACGTELDRLHSYPAALVWDDEDPATLAQEWSGDYELVARVVGVDACSVRRHFCQATPDRLDHPGRERNGYLGLWAALGIRPADTAYACVDLEPSWPALTTS
jgi:hypothetical protein